MGVCRVYTGSEGFKSKNSNVYTGRTGVRSVTTMMKTESRAGHDITKGDRVSVEFGEHRGLRGYVRWIGEPDWADEDRVGLDVPDRGDLVFVSVKNICPL